VPLLLLVLFVAVPVVELYVIIQVGRAIGLLPTLAILVADAVLGAALLRQQGRAAWRRFNAALDQRRFPGREVADGLLITVGGTLLLTPGFITDIFGLLLLIPPSRAIVRGIMRRVLGRRFQLVGGTTRWGYERMRSGGEARSGRPYDYEGTAQDVSGGPAPRREDERELPPPGRP
jgi:UPF0716 protein FxsA